MDEETVLQRLGLALGLGLLVGIQREWKASELAGVRTFPLITILGTLLATIEQRQSSSWLTVSGLLAVSAMFYVGNRAQIGQSDHRPGLTTEMAALVMYGVGTGVGYGLLAPAIVLSGVVAVLLQLKETLHRFVGRLSAQDIKAATQLVLIAVVILPLLPNRDMGWYSVLNPFKIWLMVVLIVGISLTAYVAYKLLGANRGAFVGGLLGGLISSTATTVSYARQTLEGITSATAAAMVILLASTIGQARVMFEVFVVAPSFLPIVARPLSILMITMLVISLTLWWLARRQPEQLAAEPKNPAQVKLAIFFGLTYAAVLFISAAAHEQFGDRSLYWVAGISGLTGMDAITLSTADLVKSERLSPDVGWRVILVATLANLSFKGFLAAWLGSRSLAWMIGGLFALIVLVGCGLFFWT